MGDFKGPGQWRRQAVEAREKHLADQQAAPSGEEEVPNDSDPSDANAKD